MKKLMKQICAGLLSVLICAGCLTPALAAGEGVSKDETVYLILNADGSVQRQIVSDWLHSDEGFSSYRDESRLTDVENLKSDTLPDTEEGALVWNTEETDIYYRGSSALMPPISVAITYTLDGQTITPQALEGRSGQLEIRVAAENNQWEEAVIGGEHRRICTPFFTVCAAMLSADCFKNVEAEHGTVQSDAKNELACALMLPGVAESLEGLIPDSLSEVEDYLLDEFVITADVTDCEVPTFLFAAAPDMKSLSEGLDASKFSDKLDELEEATDKLTQGAADLDDAVGTLEEKLQEFGEGYEEFDAGVNSALSGAEQLTQGAESLLDSAALLSEKTGELSDGAARLRSGTAQLSGKLNTELAQGLSAAKGQEKALQTQMLELSGALDTLVIPDMSSLKVELEEGTGQVFDAAAYNAAFYAAQNAGSQAAYSAGTQVKDGCEQVVSAAAGQIASGIQDSYRQAVAGALAAAGVDESTQTAVLNAVGSYVSADAVSSAISGGINGAIDANVTVPQNAVGDDTAAAAAAAVTEAMEPARAEAVRQVSAAVPDIDTETLTVMLGKFQDLSAQAQNMLGQVDGLTAALYNAENPADQNTVAGAASALAEGSQTLAEGASALSAGTELFSQGVGQLFAGAGSLLDGLTALSTASKTVEDSILQFQDGGGELKEGTSELREGMATFADEAIGKLLETVDPDSGLGEALDAMEESAAAYDGTGKSEDTELKVKFVMRTSAPGDTAEDKEESLADTEAMETAGEEKSFWDRVKGLFS